MDWWLHHEWKMEHPLVWELREILLMPNRNWNGSMKNKSRWKFSNCRMLLSVDTLKKKITLGSLLRWTVYTGQITWKNARPPSFMIWIKAGTAQQKHPPEIASFNLRNSSSEPSQGENKSLCTASQVGGSEQLFCAIKHAHLCLDVPSLWNTCFVGIMEFFGPWFYERQYFHNPVNVDISKWLPAGTNGTGTNLVPDGSLYTPRLPEVP